MGEKIKKKNLPSCLSYKTSYHNTYVPPSSSTDRDCLTRGMGPCLAFEPTVGYLTKHHVVGKAYLPNTSGAM